MRASRAEATRRRSSLKEDSIAGTLEGELRNHASSLVKQFASDIETSENEFKLEIEGLKADAFNACTKLGNAEQLLQLSLESETVDREPEDGEQEKTSIPMCKRTDTYRMEFRKHCEKLHDLWQQWSEIQYEIVLLAVELFGQDIVHLDHNLLPDDLPDHVDQADARYQASANADQDVLTNLSTLEANIKELCNKSISESRQQLQEIQIGKTKHLKMIDMALNSLSDI